MNGRHIYITILFSVITIFTIMNYNETRKTRILLDKAK